MDFNNFNLEEINQVLDEKHRDPNRKEIGDRVNILNYSSTTHLNGRPLDPDNDEEMQFNFVSHFIVIETRLDIIYDAFYFKYKQDLVIVNPLTNMKYRISSGHLKLQ